MVSFHFKDIAPSNITHQFCIDKCAEKIDGKKTEYAYAALTSGKYCSCGNMPPKEERFSQCRVPCDGAPDEYCGGYEDQANWFMTGFGPESEFKYNVLICCPNMFERAETVASRK